MINSYKLYEVYYYSLYELGGEILTIEEVKEKDEKQIFDRKSIQIDPKALAIPLVAFANADGGTIAIGITDKTRTIEGVDFETEKLNELLRVPFDYCNPTVKVEIERVPCVDSKGRDNHVLLMHIEASPEVHANQSDEAYLRVGDKSKLLKFEERLQLSYDKGERYFEDKMVPDATIDDIDMELVKDYIEKIGYQKSVMEYLTQNKGFVKTKNGEMQVSSAAILLFGKNPQMYFPRARVRFVKYDGVEEKFGTEMNVIKDVIFEGTILKIIRDSIAYLETQIQEKTFLGSDGTFVTEEEYPKFVRQELIVNAVTHRAYNITGTDIQIKMFNDHIVVESPGKLPGLVRTHNIRNTHFSRNPKIAEFLKAYKYVKEFGEGVNRMCNELEAAGLNQPEYYINDFMLQAIIFNSKHQKLAIETEKTGSDGEKLAIGVEKSGYEDEKLAIEDEKPDLEGEKLTIEKINILLDGQTYSEKTKKYILKIYEAIDENQIFGAPEVENILGCSTSSAKEIMKKIRALEIVEPVSGKGKGKYIFK